MSRKLGQNAHFKTEQTTDSTFLFTTNVAMVTQSHGVPAAVSAFAAKHLNRCCLSDDFQKFSSWT